MTNYRFYSWRKLACTKFRDRRRALCFSSWRRVGYFALSLNVHSFFSSQQFLYDHFHFLFRSPPSISKKKKKSGNLGDTQANLQSFFIPQPPFQTASVLIKLGERNRVFSETRIFLPVQFYATDSAYCKSLLIDKMYRLYY